MDEGWGEEPRRAAPTWRVEAACVALVVGVLGCLTWATSRTREQRVCQTSLKQIGLGMLQYMRDYDEKTPLKRNWPETVNPYVKSLQLFDCPSPRASYAMHERVAGIAMARVNEPATTPLVFDSTLNRWGGVDGGESWPVTGLHRPSLRGPWGANTVFFDGRVKWGVLKPKFEGKLRDE